MPGEIPRRWILKGAAENGAADHFEQLKISPLLARLIALRGYGDAGAAQRYLSSSLSRDLPSPFEMAGMEAAVARIVSALQRKEPIGIWGDYDVDGTTGVSVLVSFFRELGVDPVYHVPHRIEEGYGLNCAGLTRLQQKGASLVITVDCGISNAREIGVANQAGLDVIVVDHHLPPEELPAATAIINPHRRDCSFPDKGLCAAGLAFYLVIGLRARLREQGWFGGAPAPDIRRYLDIVALGTIADMVPLTGINRTLIRRGLMELASSARPGILALKRVSNIVPGAVSAGQVGFRLGPRINAAGRVDYGMKVVQLLTTDSADAARQIARELEEHNQERRDLETAVLREALAQAETIFDGGGRYSLVLAGEGWHPGVLGIVASRVVERFHRPTVVIGTQEGEGKGSARSIRGFPLVEGLRLCARHLEKFGGHEFAGGLSIKPENLAEFAQAFENAARHWLSPDDLVPWLEVDAALEFREIGMPLVRELELLQPYGIGNPEPVFMTAGAEVCDRKIFSAGVRYRLRQDGRVLGGVIFGAREDIPGIPGERIDVAYRLSENRWNGASSAELKIIDLRPAR